MTYYNARQLCHLGNTHICLLSADWVFRHFRRCVAFISDYWCCIPHALLHVHIQSFPSEACEQLSSYRKKLCVNDFSVVCFAYISEALILSSVKAPGCGWITFYIELLLLRWFLLNRLTAYFLALLRILLHKISDFHSIGTGFLVWKHCAVGWSLKWTNSVLKKINPDGIAVFETSYFGHWFQWFVCVCEISDKTTSLCWISAICIKWPFLYLDTFSLLASFALIWAHTSFSRNVPLLFGYLQLFI